jgi:hypothetical protein
VCCLAQCWRLNVEHLNVEQLNAEHTLSFKIQHIQLIYDFPRECQIEKQKTKNKKTKKAHFQQHGL